MGFYYRKSKSFGPFRINLSKSGVGYSVGGRGFRTGVSSAGRKYTSFNLPGTGIGYRTSGGGLPNIGMGRRGCAISLLPAIGGFALVGGAAAAFAKWINS